MNSKMIKPKSTAVSVLIPDSDYQKLQVVAKNQRTSISSVVRRYVGEGVDREVEAWLRLSPRRFMQLSELTQNQIRTTRMQSAHIVQRKWESKKELLG